MIRPAVREDMPALRAVMTQCHAVHPALTYEDFTHPVLVAEDDSELVGFVMGLIAWPYAYFSEAGVLPGYRQQGIYGELFHALEDTFRAAGVPAWVGFVHDGLMNHDIIQRRGAIPLAHGTMYMKVLN